MNIFHKEWNSNRIMNLTNLYKVSELMFVSIKIDLFSKLHEPKTSSELSKELTFDNDFLEIILKALVAINLLQIDKNNRYHVTPSAFPYLNKESKNSINSLIELERTMRNKRNLNEVILDLLTGESPKRIDFPEKNIYTNAMSSGTYYPALKMGRVLLKYFDKNRPINFLDLGCGPGDYALTFKKLFSNLVGTLIDREEIINITRQRLMEKNVLNDFKLIHNDFMSDPISGKYELVLLSNICHFYSLEEISHLLNKIPFNPKEESFVIIHDFFLDEELNEETFLPIFASLDWMGNHSNRFNYTLNEIGSWLESLGWMVVEQEAIKGLPTSYILIKKEKKGEGEIE
ncbi:methyltransferase domain-containing protein [Cytobacillus kochii]|uniref:class I SAM-dependent methyltransferase n=1 Tax=Cytobacillus kochii TaxID=859143 RepID=UPI001CD7FB5C|nr:class I SAM-dependent methyltransferase [Cytobacillus kochii]MCA1028648.1 methyltransferase domain-containing protein [Cytobacillus kochii]